MRGRKQNRAVEMTDCKKLYETACKWQEDMLKERAKAKSERVGILVGVLDVVGFESDSVRSRLDKGDLLGASAAMEGMVETCLRASNILHRALALEAQKNPMLVDTKEREQAVKTCPECGRAQEFDQIANQWKWLHEGDCSCRPPRGPAIGGVQRPKCSACYDVNTPRLAMMANDNAEPCCVDCFMELRQGGYSVRWVR